MFSTSTSTSEAVGFLDLRERRLALTLRQTDARLVDRAAARAGCSINIWLRGLIEARLADERALERDLARIAGALDLQTPTRTTSMRGRHACYLTGF